MTEPTTTEVVTKHTIGQRSTESILLAQRLEKVQPGELVTYAELSRIIGQNVRADGYQVLRSARNYVAETSRIVFDVVHGEGLKRLRNEEIPASADAALQSIRRKAKRTARRLGRCVDIDALPAETRNDFNLKLSVLGMLSAVSDHKRIEKVKGLLNLDGKLALADTLAAFGKQA